MASNISKNPYRVGMELCSLEDAFPNIQSGSPHVGGADAYSSKEERRAARKKAKRCKAMAPSVAAYVAEQPLYPDPDRPAIVRVNDVEAMVGARADAPKIEGFKPPRLPGSSCSFSDPGYPEYFGKGQDDIEEGFSSFSSIIGDDPNFVLQPGLLAGAFDGKGVDKATGGSLPGPNVNDTWKPLTETGSPTAFTSLPSAISAIPGWFSKAPETVDQPQYNAVTVTNEETNSKLLPMPPGYLGDDEKRAIYSRIDDLQRQLAALESEKKELHKMSQAETLTIVGGGVGILMILDLLCHVA